MDPITIAAALSALGNLAPSLIKIFTGSDKAADVAGKVIDVAKSVTGAPTGEVALATIQADPNKLLEFRLAIGAQQESWERIYLEDRQDARKMQVAALAQDDLFSKRFVYYFASAWSIFSMVYFLAVTFFPPPLDGQRIADTILGVLIASVIGVMFAYFYGTNRDSKKKDDTINKLSGG